MARWRGTRAVLLWVVLTALPASAAGPKRVLIVDPFGPGVAPFSVALSSFRSTLAREFGDRLEFCETSLDRTRFWEPEADDPFVDFLEHRIASRPMDLVATVGGPGMDFVARHHARLFPSTPVVFMAGSPEAVRSDSLRSKATQVTTTLNLAGMVEDILQALPRTTNIVVVSGASPLETLTAGECRRAFQPYTNRVGFIWLDQALLERVLKQCAGLPPRSCILHTLFLVDAAGTPFEQNEPLRRLHAVANAPIFGYFASELGLGTVGGRLYPDSEIGAHAARAAIRILRGESPGNIPPEVMDATAPVFDWRELQRWNISAAHLPANSLVRFRQPGFWERYRWPIAGGVLVCLVQAALIIGLFVNRTRRLQEEAVATLIADISSKFINLPAGEVDREIMDAQRRLCQTLGTDFSTLWQGSDETPGDFTLTHFYSAREGPQPPGRMTQDQYPWARQQLQAGRIIRMSTLEDLPAEASRDRETLRLFGIKSNLALPLSVGGQPPVGLLGLGTTKTERGWPDSLVRRLQMVAQVFANTLNRKRAEQALRQSEERLSMAADSAEAGLWMLDYRTRVFWLTEEARGIFGYPREEVIGMHRFRESVHPEDWGRVEISLARSVEAGERLSVEYRIRLADGRIRWITSRGRPHFASGGEPKSLMGLSMDITERRRTEDQLRQLSLAVEQSPVSVVITDLQGQIIYVNRKFSEVSGYAFDECIGRNPRILKSGGTSRRDYEQLWSCITRGGTWRGEFHNRRKNGEPYWEWAVIAPLIDGTGKVTHFVGVKEDVTERKRTEEALRASEARLNAGAELARLGYYEVDYGARTSFLDERFRDICGVPSAEQVGMQSMEFWMNHLHPDDVGPVLEARQKLHDGSVNPISIEYRYLHPVHGQKWIHHMACRATAGDPEQGPRTFGVIRDITREKQAEFEARELRANLTHLTRVDALGALSGSLAHELNQPLGIILSNAQAAQELLVQDPPDLPEVQAILADIVAADRRAGEVITRLRALLKRGETALQDVDLNQIIEEVFKFAQAELIGRGVSVAREFAADLPRIAGDRVQLQQLVLNLILNAVEAMAANPPGARRLHLGTRCREGRVLASVRDEGPGLPPDVERLFQPFYTTKAQGLGMGLAICRSIMAAHHGRLWAESHAERGAVFHVELPAVNERDGLAAP